MTELLDLWNKLERLFADESDQAPEIILHGLSSAELQACLTYLLRQGRQMNVSFRVGDDNTVVMVDNIALDTLLSALTDPYNQLHAVFSMHLPALPMLMYYVDAADRLSLGYTTGDEWNALTLTALFETLRTLCLLAPHAEVAIDPYFYSQGEQQLFYQVLQEYFHEQA
jgi:hypothetical protein